MDAILRSCSATDNLKWLLRAGEITFDWNGHWWERKTKPKMPWQYDYAFQRDFGLEDMVIENLSVYLISGNLLGFGKTGPQFTRIPLTASKLHCCNCGEEMEYEFNDRVVRVVNPCPYPKGYPPFTGELGIPSGNMVFANDFGFIKPQLSPYFVFGRPAEEQYWNYYLNCSVFCGYCGNSCPSVRKEGDVLIVVAGEYRGLYASWDCVAGVTTDTWQWMAGDYELLR